MGTHGFDPYGQDVGIYNELDKIHDSTATNNLSIMPWIPIGVV